MLSFRKLKFLFLYLCLGFISPASADMVLFCVDEIATGFISDSNGWRKGNFKPERFSIKIEGDWDTLVHEGVSFNCNGPIEFKGSFPKVCKSTNSTASDSFNIDKYSLRYVRTQISVAGYASRLRDEPDTDQIYAGKCEKF